MKHLIDKSALVAEIKERIDRDNEKAAFFSGGSEHDYLYRVKEAVYKNLLSFINTLEVKEIDLEKEIDNYLDDNFYISETWGIFSEKTENEINRSDLEDIAKYFFELGLKARINKTD